jgi:hypothetical protein
MSSSKPNLNFMPIQHGLSYPFLASVAVILVDLPLMLEFSVISHFHDDLKLVILEIHFNVLRNATSLII